MVDTVAQESWEGPVVTPRAVHQRYRSLFDHATSFPGWPLLIDRTRIALARAERNDLLVAVIVFDEVRRRSSASPDFTTCVASLRASVFDDDTVARIGGCTFVFVLNDVKNPEVLVDTAGAMVEALDINCRVGMAFGASPCDPEELINHARQDALPPPPSLVSRWDDEYVLGT